MQTALGLLPELYFFTLQKVRLGSSLTPKPEKIDFLGISSLKCSLPPKVYEGILLSLQRRSFNLLDFSTTLALLNGIGRSQVAVESSMIKKKFVAIKKSYL